METVTVGYSIICVLRTLAVLIFNIDSRRYFHVVVQRRLSRHRVKIDFVEIKCLFSSWNSVLLIQSFVYSSSSPGIMFCQCVDGCPCLQYADEYKLWKRCLIYQFQASSVKVSKKVELINITLRLLKWFNFLVGENVVLSIW